MPELPEVETLRKQLEKAVIGKTIAKVEVLRKKSFQGNPKQVIGKRIAAVKRRAKILIFHFTTTGHLPPAVYLFIHLKLTGQLVYKLKIKSENLKIVGGHPTSDWVNSLPSKHTRVIIIFSDGSKLYFNDQRVFGWMKIVNSQKLKVEIEKLGIEPFNRGFTPECLKDIFSKSERAIKVVLMDQQKIAGLGNIYSNDALFGAGIDPRRPAKSLKETEIEKLRGWILKVLRQGIKDGGASENTYKHLDGLGGSYQKHFLVYQQDGEKCRKCGNLIKRIKIGGRGTFFCPKCQR